MSPEQARGKPVDKRADIWAFGCVLYEMLTGQRAFDGQGVSERWRVIEREPDWARLPATLSPALRTYIRRCLQKDPRQRAGHRRRPAGAGGRVRDGPSADGRASGCGWVAARRTRRCRSDHRERRDHRHAVRLAARRAEPVPPRVSRLQVTRVPPRCPSTGTNATWQSRRTVPASFTPATKARRSSSARSTPSRRWRSPEEWAGCSFPRWTVDRLP